MFGADKFSKVETVGFNVSDSDKCRFDSCSSTNLGETLVRIQAQLPIGERVVQKAIGRTPRFISM